MNLCDSIWQEKPRDRPRHERMYVVPDTISGVRQRGGTLHTIAKTEEPSLNIRYFELNYDEHICTGSRIRIFPRGWDKPIPSWGVREEDLVAA